MSGSAQSQQYPLTNDLVLIVPGIMGSKLVDQATGKTIWGLDFKLFWQALTSPGSLTDRLAPRDEELAGDRRRVRATGLIEGPAWLSCFGFTRPYTDLVQGLRDNGVEAVESFPYDWRLDVEGTARQLAAHISARLAEWRNDPRQQAIHQQLPDNPPAGVILVAHSMGGLVVRALLRLIAAEEVEGGSAGARQLSQSIHGLAYLGVPLRGSAQAVWAATGRYTDFISDSKGLPDLVASRLSGLATAAARMPGVYDLLPDYPALREGETFTRLPPDRLTGWGADPALLDAALRRHQADAAMTPGAILQRFDHLILTKVVGHWQPTVTSVELGSAGQPQPSQTRYRVVSGQAVGPVASDGDGTVPRLPGDDQDGEQTVPVRQRHNSLQNQEVTWDQIIGLAENQYRQSITLGAATEAAIGLDPPDLALVGQPVQVEATGLDNLRTAWRMTHLETGLEAPLDRREWLDDGRAAAWFKPTLPGLYRIELGDRPAVQELIGVVSDA
ncbi:MAG: hypothetical protein LBK42_14200 [Propionibacteriaceae bacterium]|jgi:pimeloyl-ACP methyl ester carboxylesterase|nr:hypothetical protein [Propionibacteriaceae bacterium]